MIAIQYKDDVCGYDQVCWIGDSREEAEGWVESNYEEYHYSDTAGLPRSVDDISGLWQILTNVNFAGEVEPEMVYFLTEYSLRDSILYKKVWRR